MSALSPLELKKISKTYDGKKMAVNAVSFAMNPGEIFGLLGPNGAGKTSLISMITTLEEPTSGQALVFGEDVQKNSQATKKMLGVVHQEVINSGFFDVEEILKFQSGYYGIRHNQERIDFLMHKLSLYEHKHKKVKQLSGGMKRRLMIAKALVHQPRLLLLDEPTAGVDISLRESLWIFVEELRKEGVAILLTTHYLEEAENLCDRVGIINLGEIKCLDQTQSIVTQFTHRTVEIELKQAFTTSSAFLLEQSHNKFKYRLPQDMDLGALLESEKISTAMIRDIRIHEGKLEEAFLKVLEQKGGSL